MDAQKSDLKLEVRPALRVRSPRELLIFSLDDTLIDTGMYWLARAALFSAVTAKTGMGHGKHPHAGIRFRAQSGHDP
jgi:hypothetical protein